MIDKAVVYASSLGKTRKTAIYIAKSLKAEAFDLKKQTVIDLSEYKQIIFGTGIHAGRPYGPLVKFLEENKKQLVGKKVSLFICCRLGDENGKTQAEKVSAKLDIPDVYFFSGSSEKNDEGFVKAIDEFVVRMSKR
jgi:Flavodoxin